LAGPFTFDQETITAHGAQETIVIVALDPSRPVAQSLGVAPSSCIEYPSVDRATFEDVIIPNGRPAILRGLVRDWPACAAATQSRQAIAAYLKAMDCGQSVSTMLAPAEVAGRYFYDEKMRGFNFQTRSISFSDVIDKLLEIADTPSPLSIYAGSAESTKLVPTFADANPMPLLDTSIPPRLWLGNKSRIAAHYDVANNIACAVSGTRRFTLFPPDQIGNLYIGPLDFNMAGQPSSMVDFAAPDFGRFPKFATALDAALVVDLQPGDALYLPALWWHHVEAEGPFNLLVNYWWPGAGDGPAFESLALALFGIRDRAPAERAAWKAFFNHYIFDDDAAQVGDHLPEHARSVLGPPSKGRSQKMLNFVMARLNQR
jgi:hypothetical protein